MCFLERTEDSEAEYNLWLSPSRVLLDQFLQGYLNLSFFPCNKKKTARTLFDPQRFAVTIRFNLSVEMLLQMIGLQEVTGTSRSYNLHTLIQYHF